jgi:hypothetical protein
MVRDNMQDKMLANYNKTLKLANVISKEVNINILESLEREVVLIENYIKSKGSQPIGPLIQYTSTIQRITPEKYAQSFIDTIEPNSGIRTFETMVRFLIKECFL